MVGWRLRKRLHGVLIVLPLAMATIAIAPPGRGHRQVATAALIVVWGLISSAAPIGWGIWLSGCPPEDAEAGGGLMVDFSGFARILGAGMLVVSAILALLSRRCNTTVSHGA